MSITHLLDHTARVWRRVPPEQALGALGAEERRYEEVGLVALALNRPVAPVGNPGPGLTPQGTRRIYADPEVDVRPLDVLELVTGPEAPGKWEVDDPVTRPRGHHHHELHTHFI